MRPAAELFVDILFLLLAFGAIKLAAWMNKLPLQFFDFRDQVSAKIFIAAGVLLTWWSGSILHFFWPSLPLFDPRPFMPGAALISGMLWSEIEDLR